MKEICMKKIICALLPLYVALCCCSAEKANFRTLLLKMQTQDSAAVLEKQFPKFGIQSTKPVSSEHLAVVNYILKHTYENSIHKMRGESENKIYVNDDGRELVYDADGNLVTNYNRGTYNYASYDKPVDKFLLDFLPWILLGVSKDDPTSFEERLYYYCTDLNWGIQSYVFLDDKSELESLSYDDLTDTEKMVYQFFSYLIFNETYEIRLEDKTIPRLRQDVDFYWAYFEQITKTVGL